MKMGRIVGFFLVGFKPDFCPTFWKFQPYVTVLGYPPLPAWSLSDGRQAQQGLHTDVMTFHNWLSILQMVAPGEAI